MSYRYTNNLIHSTSPYLLQHAHNPVNWQPWGDEVVEKAQKENKLILISIGYAACHWCHVMEHESFEDEQVAAIMNRNFICVKVDREERPDVDHYYMTAVQLMLQHGGWPLNVIALPDGRPIWGGTYFQKEMWKQNLSAVAAFYAENKEKAEDYAGNLQNGIHQALLVTEPETYFPANTKLLEQGLHQWKPKFDLKNGGKMGHPKFPMPVNLDFLMYYGWLKNDKTVVDFVEVTLEKMARGGIYDQVGGGFARYSVDELWKVPHFEKMLYDNGQLLSVYSKGFQLYKHDEFKNVVYETVGFIERELLHPGGAFYSSLDADSDGEEGLFYIWNKTELQSILKEDFQVFTDYYNVNSKGFWENGNYILVRDEPDENFAERNGLSPEQFQKKITGWKNLLLEERSKRVRPGLDDKTLTSWNALVIQGLTDAFRAFSENHFLELALNNAGFLKENLIDPDGRLFHTWKNGKNSVDGFLEDYAHVIQAFLSLYEITGNVSWLEETKKITEYTLENFFDEKNGLFLFSKKNTKSVVTNHYPTEDNVIPAANSVMANNLHRLYLFLGNPGYLSTVKKMVQHIIPQFSSYPMAYANWGNVMLKIAEPGFEVAVCGQNSKQFVNELQSGFYPHVLWAFSTAEVDVPLLKDRFVPGKTLIYVCREGACQLPVERVEDAVQLLGRI